MGNCILVTAFEPFGGDAVNPSWEAVKALPDKISEYDVHKEVLPVEFGGASKLLLELAGKLAPEVIICTGLAKGRKHITPEKIAVNVRTARIPDNAGKMPKGEPVIPGGPDGIFSSLPVSGIADALNSCGIPAQVSYSAGTYVCNDVFYNLMHRFSDTGVKCGFIHIPDTDSIPTEIVTSSLVKCIEVTRRYHNIPIKK